MSTISVSFIYHLNPSVIYIYFFISRSNPYWQELFVPRQSSPNQPSLCILCVFQLSLPPLSSCWRKTTILILPFLPTSCLLFTVAISHPDLSCVSLSVLMTNGELMTPSPRGTVPTLVCWQHCPAKGLHNQINLCRMLVMNMFLTINKNKGSLFFANIHF